MNSDLATLVVRLEAEVGRYQRDLERANRSAENWRRRTTRSVNTVQQVFKGFIAALAINQSLSFYQKHAEAIDSLAAQSDKLGIATNALLGLRHASELTGAGANVLDMGLQRMTRRIAEAAKGTGEAKGALEELGLSAQTLAELSPDEQFIAIARAMKDVEGQSHKVRLSMKLFDSEGVALVNTLALGEEGLRAARTEIETLGASVSRVDAAKVEAAGAAMGRVNQAFSGFGKRVVVETAPLVEALANKFLNAAQEAGGIANITQTAMRIVLSRVGMAADVVRGLKLAWMGVRNAIATAASTMLDFFGGIAASGSSIASKLGFGEQALKDIAAFSDSFKITLQGFREEFQNAVMERMPSETVNAWVEDVFVQAESAAQAVAASSKLNIGGSLGEEGGGDATQSPNVKNAEEEYTILDSLRQQHINKQLRMEARYQLLVENFQKASSAGKVAIVAGEVGQMLNIASSGSKKLFELNKKVGIANALISTYQGIAKGVAMGWPLGIPAVAWATVQGFAQVRRLRSQSFGGSAGALSSGGAGNVPSVGSTTQIPDTAIAPAQNDDDLEQPGRSVNVVFQGDVYGLEDFNDKVIDVLAENSDARRIVISDASGVNRLEVNR